MKNEFLNGIKHLKKDKYLGSIVSKMKVPHFAHEPIFFQSLLKYIIYQQLSIKAARKIYDRLIDLFKNQEINPLNFKKIKHALLLEVGISNSKVRYMNEIADRFLNDKYFLSNVSTLSDQKVIEDLINIKGVGPWTCDMFLMFTLNRLDIFPIKDLGIKKGVQQLFKLNKIPTDEFMIKESKRWRPYRTIACLYLWKLIDGNDFEW